MLANFLSALFKLYIDLNFVYMEINPIVVVGERITPLDMAAKIDETAAFLCGPKWGEIDFPAPFGERLFCCFQLISTGDVDRERSVWCATSDQAIGLKVNSDGRELVIGN